jgi:hypothetical protein
MQTLTTAMTEVEIKGATYCVEPIPAGEFGVSAVRVIKLVNGESYDVIRQHDGLVECSCPDFVCRHEGQGTVCKHGAAMIARGFLPVAPAVAPAPSRPSVAPITRKDIAAARMFGLRLPVAPIAVEATPAPIAVAIAAPVALVIEPTAVANPRDSWPDWTDEDVWTITDEASAVVVEPTPALEFVAEPLPALSNPVEFQDVAEADRVPFGWGSVDLPIEPAPIASEPARIGAGGRLAWLAENATSYLTLSAFDLLDEDRDDQADRIWDTLEPENRELVEAFLASVGLAGKTWVQWLDTCMSGTPVFFPEPSPSVEARPSRRDRRHSILDEANFLGWELGYGGQDPLAPANWSALRLAHFYLGVADGQAELHRETEDEHHAWLDSLEARFPDRFEDLDHADLAEAGVASGHPSFES